MKRSWLIFLLFLVQAVCALFFVGDIVTSVLGLPLGRFLGKSESCWRLAPLSACCWACCWAALRCGAR